MQQVLMFFFRFQTFLFPNENIFTTGMMFFLQFIAFKPYSILCIIFAKGFSAFALKLNVSVFALLSFSLLGLNILLHHFRNLLIFACSTLSTVNSWLVYVCVCFLLNFDDRVSRVTKLMGIITMLMLLPNSGANGNIQKYCKTHFTHTYALLHLLSQHCACTSSGGVV